MPETYGQPEDEPTRVERAAEATVQFIAGQGIVRRIILYVLAAGLALSPVAPLAVVPVVLLIATDRNL